MQYTWTWMLVDVIHFYYLMENEMENCGELPIQTEHVFMMRMKMESQWKPK